MSEKPITAAASTSATSRKLDNTTASIPIVYGSVAFYLGKRADEFNTHQWTLYLRGANGEDLSTVISKVVFHLHPSFAQPTREITAPPYEVTERGWGEFEAQIRITWKDTNEKSTVISHQIRLYPPGTPANAPPADPKIPVVAEVYDEVVFTDPSDKFFTSMRKLESTEAPSYTQQDHFQAYSGTDDFKALIEAQKVLEIELQQAKDRLGVVDSEMAQIDEKIREFQERKTQSTGTSSSARAGTSTKTTAVRPRT